LKQRWYNQRKFIKQKEDAPVARFAGITAIKSRQKVGKRCATINGKQPLKLYGLIENKGKGKDGIEQSGKR